MIATLSLTGDEDDRKDDPLDGQEAGLEKWIGPGRTGPHKMNTSTDCTGLLLYALEKSRLYCFLQ